MKGLFVLRCRKIAGHLSGARFEWRGCANRQNKPIIKKPHFSSEVICASQTIGTAAKEK